MEVKVWGKYYEEFQFDIRQFNDRLLLNEILQSERFIELNKNTFDKEVSRIREGYKKIEIESGKKM